MNGGYALAAGIVMRGLMCRGGACMHRSLSLTVARHDLIPPPIALDNSISIKKRAHKKRTANEMAQRDGVYLVLAYATANLYDLPAIRNKLLQQNLYETGKLSELDGGEVVHASARYRIGEEPREIFFFKEGACVLWNCSETEAGSVLELLTDVEREPYPSQVVQRERELMTYSYSKTVKRCGLLDSHFVLVGDSDNVLEKFTFSNAMAQSVKLGAWEAALERMAQRVRAVSEDMESGRALALDKAHVVRQLGELLSLRHRINVESDLLDTPDFYWEQEQLEKLYASTVAYFSIQRRTRVLNERLSHCVELVELLAGWVADKHHVRLEWMIIALILVEVCFELLHFVERYSPTEESVAPPPQPHLHPNQDFSHTPHYTTATTVN